MINSKIKRYKKSRRNLIRLNFKKRNAKALEIQKRIMILEERKLRISI
jgi:hypothetical protein